MQESGKRVADAAAAGGAGAGAREASGEGGRQLGQTIAQGTGAGAVPFVSSLAGEVGAGVGKTTYKIAAAAASVLLLVLVLILATSTSLLAALTGSGQSEMAPPPTAEQCTAMPEKWCDVAYFAQKYTADNDVPVPWTLIAGIASVQTDFGRTSPYDTIDRYPDRPVPKYLADHPGGYSVGDGSAGDVTGAGVPKGSVAGMSSAQMKNAATIIKVGKQLGIPEKGWVIAIAVALQESTLVNLHYGDRDSQGLFQQRPSAGWGTVAQITNPVLSTQAFYGKAKHTHNRGLTDVKGWESMAVTVAAQKVQVSCCPSAYAKHEPVARALVAKLKDDPSTAVSGYTAAPADSTPASPGTTTPATDPSATTGDGSYQEKGGAGCPVAPPPTAIGGKLGQGSGPFLLNQTAAASIGAVAAQNPCDAAIEVAKRVSEAAGQIQREGVYRLDPLKPDKSPEFWQQALIRADILVAGTAITDCGTADGVTDSDPVDSLIDSIWTCELGQASSLNVVDDASVDTDGKVTFDTLDRSSGTAQLISEAKTVSWNFSHWKTAKCDANAALAGIFPLRQDVATANGAANRCDARANILAAARAVAAKESVAVDKRPTPAGQPFAPMLGGWASMPDALGNDLAPFTLTGPARTWNPSDSCRAAVEKNLRAAGQSDSPFKALAKAAQMPKDQAVYQAWLSTHGPDLTKAAPCAPPDTADLAAVYAEVGQNLSDAAVGESEDDGDKPAGSDDPSANLGYDVAAMRGLTFWYENAPSSEDATPKAVWNKDSVIDRLSTVSRIIDVPDSPDSRLKLDPESWQTRSTDWAWFYGGLVKPWDTFGQRRGSLLLNSGQQAGDAGTWGTASQQAEIVIKAAKSQLGVPYSWGGGGPGGKSLGFAQGAHTVGFDCSGLTEYAYSKVGLHIGGDTYAQIKSGTAVRGGLANALPGDLLFFPGHVAIYLGNNMLIHAPHTGDVVRIAKLWTAPIAIRRVLTDAPAGESHGTMLNSARTTMDGKSLSVIAKKQIELAERESGIQMHIMQGGYGGSHIAASGTSHNYSGVVDVSPGSIKVETALRKAGFAAWARNIPGRSQVGSGAHVHAVSLLDAGDKNSPQVKFSWPNHGNGLTGSHNDPASHPAWYPGLEAKVK